MKRRIALIQNRSEMMHYSYADFRPVLDDLQFEYDLFTSTNIDQLPEFTKRFTYDAIVIGTNALHDQTILASMSTDRISGAVSDCVRSGCGLLLLMQYRLARNGEPMPSFLEDVEALWPISRTTNNPEETALDGKIEKSELPSNSLLLTYPESVELQSLQEDLKENPALKALYWHWWAKLNPAIWDEVLVGSCDGDSDRTLLAVSKDVDARRVVLCSIPIDWMKPKSLTENVIRYVVEGIPRAAILGGSRASAFSFEYLRRMFATRRISLSEYPVSDQMPSLTRNVSDGVHNVLITAPGIRVADLPEETKNACIERLEKGDFTIIQFDDEEDALSGFSVAGRQRESLNYLGSTITTVRAQLTNGFVDGSFWATIECLQVLERLSNNFPQKRFGAETVLKLAADHDIKGSYDEVFGVSVAFAWLRGKYLGPDDPSTQKTAQWIRSHLESQSALDQIASLRVFNEVGIINEKEVGKAIQIIKSINLSSLTEIQLLSLLQSSIAFFDSTVTREILLALINALEKGEAASAFSSDIPLAASLVATLLDARNHLQSSDTIKPAIWQALESIVFDSIIQIQGHPTIARMNNADGPWWDGNWSTCLKCIEAWVRFDETLSLPVYESSLILGETRDRNETSRLVQRDLSVFQNISEKLQAASSSAEQFQLENQKLNNREKEASRKLRLAHRWGTAMSFVTLFLAYGMGTFIYATVRMAPKGWVAVIDFALARLWVVHVGFASAVIAAIGLYLTWRKSRGSGADD